MKVAMIDNYDSFTYNLVHYMQSLDCEVDVYKNDEVTLRDLEFYTHLLISPGFGSPKDSKMSLEIIRYYAPSKRILGVCLGHQCIAQVFGGIVSRLPEPVHGKVSKIILKPSRIFEGLPNVLKVGRYHSLHVSNLSEELIELALSEEGILMALKHKNHEVYGLQFHPESILSEGGKKILQNFLKL